MTTNQDHINDFSIPVHSYDQLQSKRSDLLNRHGNLNGQVSERRDRLQQLAVLQDWRSTASGLEAWITEKTRQAQQAIDEDELAGHGEDSTELIEIKLAKHSAVEAEVEKNMSRLDNLEERANVFNTLPRITGNERASVGAKIQELRDMWKILAELLSRRRLNLDRQHTLLKLYRLCHAFKFFINEKNPLATSQDIGANLEECTLIQQQFDNLKSEVVAYEKKLLEIREIGQELLQDEIASNDPVVQEKLDECNTVWQSLNEAIAARDVQLHDALAMHQFIRDANQVLQWMNAKHKDITQDREGNEALMNGTDYAQLVSRISQLLSNHDIVEKNLEALGDKVSSLHGRAAKLEESLTQKSDQLLSKRDELHETWLQLQELSEIYRKQLRHQREYLQFLNKATNLITWAGNFKEKFASEITPENLTEVEAEISKHKDLKIVLDERRKEFNLAIAEGKAVEDFDHEGNSRDQTVDSLEESLKEAEDAWMRRDRHLSEVETFLSWTRDADSIDKKLSHVVEQIDEDEAGSDDSPATKDGAVDLESLRRKRGFNESLRRQTDGLQSEVNELIEKFERLQNDHYEYPAMETRRAELSTALNDLKSRVRNLSKGLQQHSDIYTLLRDYEIVTQNLNEKANTIKKQKIPKHDVAKALEQHDATTKAIGALEPNVQKLIADPIAPEDKAVELSTLWEQVNELAAEHRSALGQADTSEKFDRQCDDLKSYLDEVEVQVQIPAEQLCRDLPTTRDANKRHADLCEDFQAHKPQIQAMEQRAEECGATDIAENLSNRYNQLQVPISAKTRKLEDYLVAYDLLAELNDVDDWIKLKSRQVNSSNVGRDLLSCLRLKTKHADIVSELVSNRQRTEALIERGRRERAVEAVPLLADRLKDDWGILNEQAKARSDNLDAAEKTHEYFVGADEALGWLSEKRPAVESKEIARDEDTAEIILSRHRQLIDDIKAYKPRIEELGEKAKVCTMDELTLETGKDNKITVEIVQDFIESNPREISVRKGDRLVLVATIDNDWSKVQQADGRQGLVPNSCLERIDTNMSPSKLSSGPQSEVRSVQETQSELENAYQGLLENAEVRDVKLAKVSKALALQREAADLQRWIREKEAEIDEQCREAQERGDIDGAKKILERTQREIRGGQKRLNDLLASAKEAGVEGVSSDDMLENWNRLQAKYDEMSDKLAGAYKLQRFLQDCIETTDWIGEKQRILISIDPTVADIDITQLEAMRRRHEGLQRDLQALGQRVHTLDESADQLVRHAQEGKLQPQLLGEKTVDMMEQAEIIQKKRNDLNTAWNELVTTTKARKKQLGHAESFHKFLADQQELVKWMDQMHGVMSTVTDKKPTDIADAQNLIDRHRSTYTDLESRNADFTRVTERGEKLINQNHPESERIETRLNELAQRKRELVTDWEEKNARLNEEYKLQQFERDCTLCENWIGNREGQLEDLDQAPSDSDIQKAQNLKKSADLQRQIDQYQPRIDQVAQKADELISTGHYASQGITARKSDVLSRWDGLRSGLKGWQSRLGNAQNVQQYCQQAEDLNEWMDDKISCLPQGQADDDMIRGRQRRQDALQAELDTTRPRVERLLNDGGELLAQQGPGDQEHADIENAMSKLNDKWAKLAAMTQENAARLQEASRQLDWLTHLKDFEMWIDEMRAIIENVPNSFEHLEQAQSALVKHNQRMTDVEAQAIRRDYLQAESEQLVSSGNFDTDLINGRMDAVNQKYDALNALGLRKERMLNEQVKALELLAAISGERDWVNSSVNELKVRAESSSRLEAELDLRWLNQLDDDVRDRRDRQTHSLGNQAKQLESEPVVSSALVELCQLYDDFINMITEKRTQITALIERYTKMDQYNELQQWLKTRIALLESEREAQTEKESLPKALSAKHKFTQLWNTYQTVYVSKISAVPELAESQQAFESIANHRRNQIDASVAFLEFQWKMQAVQAWMAERMGQLEKAEMPKDLTQCESLLSKHQAFERGLHVFEDEAMENLRRLAADISQFADEPGQWLNQLESKWSQLTSSSAAHKERLEKAKREFLALNELMARFASEASRFNSWFEQVEEDFTDPIHADNVTDIKEQISEFRKFKTTLPSYETNVAELGALDEQIKRYGSKTNPYTWHTMDSIEKLWQHAGQLIEKREAQLKSELNRQEINDRLCQNYAEAANQFHEYLSQIRSAMNDGESAGDTNLEQRLAQLQKLSENIRSQRGALDKIETQVADLDQRGVEDIDRYTKHSVVKLSQIYDQLSNQNLRMQHNLQQQIQAMNDSGVPEETLRDINIMFKYFDKDQSGVLEHAELKSCLRALGVNMSIPDDPTEASPEFEAVLDKLDPNRDGKVSFNEYLNYMIQRETSKLSGTSNVIAAFKNIASSERPYLTKEDIRKNLTKEQARFALEHMVPYVDAEGNTIPDTYDYERFVAQLFT